MYQSLALKIRCFPKIFLGTSYSEASLCRAVKENDGACGGWWNGVRAGGTDRPCDGREGLAVGSLLVLKVCCFLLRSVQPCDNGLVWTFVYIVTGRSSSFLVKLFSFFFLGTKRP